MRINILKCLAVAVALSVLSGCIVSSVYPFYTDKDLTFDSSLVGRWNSVNGNNEFWQFASVNGIAYRLTTVSKDETNGVDAHLFQLKKVQFLDLLTTNRSMYAMPTHLIAKVVRNDSQLSLQFLDYGWLSDLLESHPALLHHVIVPNDSSDANGGHMFYLTGDTKELQVFLSSHADDTNAFNNDSVIELKRASQ